MAPNSSHGGARDGAGRKKRTCPNCESLAAEVARLKRELAGREPKAFTRMEGVTEIRGGMVNGKWVERYRRLPDRVSPAAEAQNAHKATITPHGPRCQCIGCRAR